MILNLSIALNSLSIPVPTMLVVNLALGHMIWALGEKMLLWMIVRAFSRQSYLPSPRLPSPTVHSAASMPLDVTPTQIAQRIIQTALFPSAGRSVV